MARYIYARCSTIEQDFMQQQNCINTYLTQHGVNPDKDISKTVVEKISGTVRHTERKLAGLLAKCKQGDTIYISELSRLGRNMSDLFAIVTESCEKGVTIVQCKDGSTIENESIGGKALLFALSLAAEIEVQNIRQRTQMGLDARKKLLEEQGSFVSKSGNICTKFGRPKRVEGEPYDLSGLEAAAAARTDAAITWRERSQSVRFVRRKRAEGWGVIQITEELGKLYDEFSTADGGINPYATPSGCKPQKGTVSRWCREMNPIAI